MLLPKMDTYNEITPPPYATSKWLVNFHKFLGKSFYKLGQVIAINPFYFIIIPVFISMIGITGLQQINYIKDAEYLFTPTTGESQTERRIVQSLFPVNMSDNYDIYRITKLAPFAHLLVTAKDSGTMFRMDVFEELATLDEAIRSLSIEWDGDNYNYPALCTKINGNCSDNIVLNLREFMPEIENGSMLINYPIMLYPLSLPYAYGGPVVNESEGVLLEAQAIQLFYTFLADNRNQERRSHAFEKKVLEFLEMAEFDHIRVACIVSKSLDAELERNVYSRTPYVFLSSFLMASFIVISLSMSDWVRSKLNIGLLGMLSAALATGGSFGTLIYCGIPFAGINMVIPFLMIGIGIDDMFVVLSAWQRTSIQDEVPVRLAKTYSEAAVSVTITSLTDMLSFFVGILTPFPAIRIFCIYTGFAVLFTYIWFITFFGGCLAKAGYLESKGKHCITGRPALPKSKAENLGSCYRFWCTGGIDPQDPWNPKDNEDHAVMIFFRDRFGKTLNIPAVKVLVICAFLVYLSGAFYGCSRVKEGLQLKKLALDDSYLIDYFDIYDSMFKKYPHRIQVIINEKLDYSDPETKNAVLELHEKFENLSIVAPPIFSESWIRGFYKFLDRRPQLQAKITDEKSFIEILKSEYLARAKIVPEHLDIKFNENGTEIIASRFMIQTYDIKDATEEVNMMLELRKVAKEAKFDVAVYNIMFHTFDQYAMMRYTCIQTVSLAAVVMMIVSAILIPNPICCLWIAFSIISIEAGVLGYMTLWNVNLDSISIVNLIICVGFSVDFSAHISYAFLTSRASTVAGKVEDCLYVMGLPILQGGLSTIIAVLALNISPSYLFSTFFKTIFLVITFGMLHSLLLLPVLLSILGIGSSKSEKSTECKQIKTQNQLVVDHGTFSPRPMGMKADVMIYDNERLNKDLRIGSSSLSSYHTSLSDDYSLPEVTESSSIDNELSEFASESSDEGNQNKAFIFDNEKEFIGERL